MNRGSELRIGIPNRGRLFSESARLLRSVIGTDVSLGRLLFHRVSESLELVCARSADLPRLAARGVVDAVITGDDYVVESGSKLERAADLRIAPGKICLLSQFADPFDGAGPSGPIIVTQYPHLTSCWSTKSGLSMKIVTVAGAAELYPRIDLADAIVDNVTSGETAEVNGLNVVREIMDTSGALYVNSSLSKGAKDLLDPIIDQLRSLSERANPVGSPL